MENTLPSQNLEVKHSGLAIECGTLTTLLEAIIQQPVMVMPLERTGRRGSLTIHQWILHLTTRSSTKDPVYYATFRVAEAVQRDTGLFLTSPYLLGGHEVMSCAHFLQQQVQTCIETLLSQSARVSNVVAPMRYRLPDEWVWSANCQDPRIQYRDGAWVLIEL